MGSNLPSDFVADLCRKIPLIQYVKEERYPHGVRVSEVIHLGGTGIKGIFTGGTQLGLVTGYRRGAAGNMAAIERGEPLVRKGNKPASVRDR
ncbi:hypothetical protein ACFL6S_28845 [Candidatus Poribacteria bacterium]